MRYAILTLATALLPNLASADSIATFKSLCLANIGDVSAISAAANRAGFDLIGIDDDAFMGTQPSTDESIQVNIATRHSFECAVTTSDMANPSQISANFFAALGIQTTGSTARGSINGKIYTFMHDTNGGEAFVVYAD